MIEILTRNITFSNIVESHQREPTWINWINIKHTQWESTKTETGQLTIHKRNETNLSKAQKPQNIPTKQNSEKKWGNIQCMSSISSQPMIVKNHQPKFCKQR